MCYEAVEEFHPGDSSYLHGRGCPKYSVVFLKKLIIVPSVVPDAQALKLG